MSAYEVAIRVVDDTGANVTDANVTIDFVGYIQGSGKAYRGVTGDDGMFRANGNAQHSVFVVANKTGHYEARLDRLSKDRNIDMTVVVPRILNPVPLYLFQANPAIPVQNEWVGYDFEAGDWVAPFGVGRITDLRVRYSNTFLGWKFSEKELAHIRHVNRDESEEIIRNIYGKWDAVMDISFPGEKEGMHEELRFLEYSKLELPHTAPADGYQPTWRYERKNYQPPTTRDNVGFFLRTRVKLDPDGKIISANYAKLIGDIRFAHTGVLIFTYYYNPTPNDRNLEFDPKHNLFPADRPGANVHDP
ncbi:MAG: hypothetical protein K9M98_12605 [Cephaloticoccus sp.]|nr:hypothetical protein [Cephaloticoccus sp.]MCF7761333.1 hypothetical protein [Cephaloticoccus sp.]